MISLRIIHDGLQQRHCVGFVYFRFGHLAYSDVDYNSKLIGYLWNNVTKFAFSGLFLLRETCGW